MFHVLHVLQQRATQVIPASFPWVRPLGPHLGKEVWDLGNSLVGTQHIFPKGETVFVLVRLGFDECRNHLHTCKVCLLVHSMGSLVYL